MPHSGFGVECVQAMGSSFFFRSYFLFHSLVVFPSGSELQKDYFCPVSQFSKVKCPNHAYGEYCNNMRHKSKLSLVFYSFIVFLS